MREVISLLFGIVDRINPACTPPTLFDSASEQLTWIVSKYPGLFDSDEIDEVQARLRFASNTVYAYTGEPHHHLSKEHREEFEKTSQPGSTERERLAEFIHFLEASDQSEAEVFQKVADEWDAINQSNIGAIVIPLVEQDLTQGLLHKFVPFVVPATLQIQVDSSTPAPETDQFNLGNIAQHDSAVILDELQEGTNAARSLSSILIRPFKRHNYAITLSVRELGVQYTGKSFGLGFAVNLVSLLSYHSMDRRYYKIESGTVFTGRTNSQGDVLPVDDEHVRTKLQGLIYSPYKRLVLPWEHERSAYAVIESMHEKSPDRNLEIIPVKQLGDVFDRRQVIAVRRFSAWKRGIKFYRRHQSVITLGLLGIVISLIGAYILFVVDFDTNPHKVVVERGVYVVKNKRGTELWTKEIEHPTYNFSPSYWEEQILYGTMWKRYAVADLDNDGSNEVLLGHAFSYHGYSDSIYCYNADGSRRWAQPVGIPTVTNENDYRQSPFRVQTIWVGVLDSTGAQRIIVSCCTDFYSNVVYIIDNEGNKLADYLHPGSLVWATVIPAPDSSGYEIVLCGAHNGYRQPVVVVLDPKYVSGTAPEQESHRFLQPKRPPAAEKYYIRFPRTQINDIYGVNPLPYPNLASMGPMGRVFNVNEAALEPPDSGLAIPTAHVFYEFTNDMKLLSIQTSSTYDKLYRAAMKSGFTSRQLGKTYFDSLKTHVEWWDGEKFINTPTMNKRYLEAKE
ncbi:MAG: hypothetical protein CL946_01000 [Ectothiorhodospiraceae bacterium]|nr:hypothetical protein [Ectothiorhodospiraceae bacterium]